MAKIKLVKKEIAGKSYELTIQYSDNKFFIKLPEEVFVAELTELAMKKYMRGGYATILESDTESELTDGLDEYIEKFETTKRLERKVIMVQFVYDSNRWSSHSFNNDYSRKPIEESDRKDVFDSKVEIKMELKIADEITVGDRIEYKDGGTVICDNQQNKRALESYTIVQYTAEREEFLRKFYANLANLIDAMKKSFLDESTFQQLITGKIKLLN